MMAAMLWSDSPPEASPLPAFVESVAPGMRTTRLSAAVDWSSLEPGDGAVPTRYLLVGDSMAWALGTQLEPLLVERGHKLMTKSQISGSIRGYSRKRAKQFRDSVQKYHPDAVIIVLGSNEALVPHPEQLQKPIKSVVEAVGDRKCYWIGPPMWRQDTGIVKLLSDNAGPCKFFDSSVLELERRPDKIHPTPSGSKTWALAVRAWLLGEAVSSPHP
jgi:lysophospholipase L1-like esterase